MKIITKILRWYWSIGVLILIGIVTQSFRGTDYSTYGAVTYFDDSQVHAY